MRSLLFTGIFVTSLLAAGSTVTSQRSDEPRPASSNRNIDYEFRIGERIRASLLSNCSIVTGVVRGVPDQGLELAIEELLSGDGHDKPETVALVLPQYTGKFASSPAWENATAKPGSRLLVSRCGGDAEKGRLTTVVSDEAYFPSIRDIVGFDLLLSQNPSVISDLPRMLTGRENAIFAGYAIRVLNASLDNGSDVAVALGRILEDRSVPPGGLALARIKLRQLLIKEGERALPPDVRRQVLSLIVEAGSRHEPTDQVFVLLNELAERNKLDIKDIVTEANRQSLRTNYKTFLKNNRDFKPQPSLEKQLVESDKRGRH